MNLSESAKYENAKYQIKLQEIIIYAKVGREQDREIVGKYGLGSYNECVEKWVH